MRASVSACVGVRKARTAPLLIMVFGVFALVAGACGDDDGASSTSASTAQDEGASRVTRAPSNVDPHGVLRLATNFTIGATGYQLDPAKGAIATYDGVTYLIYGMPLVLGPEGTVEPYLAEGFEIVDSKTMVLTLRPELTFQDGQPYDAATLRQALLDRRRVEEPAFNNATLKQIADIAADGPTQLTITTTNPVAGLLPYMLATGLAAVAAPGSDPELPAGAGPFRPVEYRDHEFLKLEKWDGFFGADEYLLKGIEYSHLPAREAAQNALRAGQVDLISTSAGDVDALIAPGSFGKVVTNNESYYYLTLCQATPPFDDARFREAFDLAIDRTQLNQIVMGGNAVPMEGIWPPDSELAVEGLADPAGDQDAARQILDELDWDSSTVIPIGVYGQVQTQLRMLEVIQGQLDEVGIKVEVVPVVTVQTDVINTTTGGGMILANIYPGVQKVTRTLLEPGSPGNACDHPIPELADLATQIVAGDLSEAVRQDVWAQIQTEVATDHLQIPLVTQPAVYAFNDERVQGLAPGAVGLSGATHPSPFLHGVSIIAS